MLLFSMSPMAELDAMTPRFSQWLPGHEVPEKHWMYKIAKRFWFHDFNAYDRAAPDAEEKALDLQKQLEGTSAKAAAA